MNRHTIRGLLGVALGLGVAAPLSAQTNLPPAPGHRVAVLIGVSAYDAPNMNLRGPANDVDALEVRLKRLGFATVLKLTSRPQPKAPARAVNAVAAALAATTPLAVGGAFGLLHADPRPAGWPTRTRILDAFQKELPELVKANKDDTLVLVYVAAHGEQHRPKGAAAADADSRGYFLPTDADPKTGANYYAKKDVLTQVSELGVGHGVIVFETCRLVEADAGRPPASVFTDDDVRDAKGLHVVESSSPGTEASLDPQFLRGRFAHYFLKGLEQEGALGDQISLHRVLRYADENTRKRSNREQKPQLFPDGLRGRDDLSLGLRKGMTLAGVIGTAHKVEPKQVTGDTADATALATFRHCDFSGATKLQGVSFALTTFEDVSLAGVDLTGADLSLATFKNVDLTGARIGAGTSLVGTRFENVTWTGADLDGSDFRFVAEVDANALKKAQGKFQLPAGAQAKPAAPAPVTADGRRRGTPPSALAVATAFVAEAAAGEAARAAAAGEAARAAAVAAAEVVATATAFVLESAGAKAARPASLAGAVGHQRGSGAGGQ